jgi:3',5'-cyclic AMP phosphodiesterase CpdA
MTSALRPPAGGLRLSPLDGARCVLLQRAGRAFTPRRPALRLTLAFLLLSASGTAQERGASPPWLSIPVTRGDSLVEFVSDAQSPIFLETLRLSRNNNDSAREMIYSRILADRPDAIFTLGDMVSLGFFASTWKSLDAFLERAREAQIPMFPTLGNHELMLFASNGAEEFYGRYPWYRKTGYAVRAGKLAVTVLNSNFSQLSGQEQKNQVVWLDSTLAAFEADTSVGIVIVACHHPPFTNSTVVSPSVEVQGSFVPIYLRYAKCRLFLSGHCHAFEHFRQGGKDFLVIGGGGGLQQPLLTGSEAKWVDLFPRKTEKRMFHYLKCRITGEGLEVSVRMVKEDFSGFEEAYSLSYAFTPSIRQ